MATDDKRMDMTQETKAYLDAHFQRLEQRMVDITDPIKKTLEDFRKNFVGIYERLGITETKIAILEDNKGSRQNNAPIIISIIFGVVMAALAVIGFIN